MSPYLYVAQHISLCAEAHCCSWLPKCSGVNATRHHATRRDTRISPSCDQHGSRDIALRGKRHVASPTNHNPGRGICVRSVRYLLQRGPAGRRRGGGAGGDRGYRITMARCFDACFSPGMDRDVSKNRAVTCDRGVPTYLDHRQIRYLVSYLMQGVCVYRDQDFGDNRAPSREPATVVDRCQYRAPYRAVRWQTDIHHDAGATCMPARSTIVTDVVGRVAYTITSRAVPRIRDQLPCTVGHQMLHRITTAAI